MTGERTRFVLDLDAQTVVQLARALDRYVRQSRTNGRRPTDGLLALTAWATETATDRPTPTSFDTPARAVHAGPVQQALVMSYVEAAKALGVSKRTIERMVKSGKLVPIRETGAPRIPVAQVRALIEGRNSGDGLRRPPQLLRPDAPAADR